MELTEPVEKINQQLSDRFGIDTITGLPMWRVVFSDDQFERRLGTYDDYTPGGLYIRTVIEVRTVPKYRQWIHHKYVLESLVLIPEMNQKDLPATKMSYEPIYVFQTDKGDYLPPKMNACEFVIQTINAVKGIGKVNIYKDPEAGLSSKELLAQKNERINKLQEELFGNETDISDSLAHSEGIVVPRNYKEMN